MAVRCNKKAHKSNGTKFGAFWTSFFFCQVKVHLEEENFMLAASITVPVQKNGGLKVKNTLAVDVQINLTLHH